MNYYNEFDKKAAAWLRELIKQGHIPKGDVDERSITDVKPHELTQYTQCHFFAGIGGWSLALRLAGWPDDKRVRTGSCPCQPFSVAGKGLGEADERHLWPHLRGLMQADSTITFGEQVASSLGRDWLAGVRVDLEALGYEVGSADLCAASAGEEGEGWIVRGSSIASERIVIGAPHIRQRLYWVAEPAGQQQQGDCGRALRLDGGREAFRQTERQAGAIERGSNRQVLGWVEKSGPQPARGQLFRPGEGAKAAGERTPDQLGGSGGFGNSGLVQSFEPGLEGQSGNGDGGDQPGRLSQEQDRPVAETSAVGDGLEHAASDGREQRRAEPSGRGTAERREPGAWSSFDLIPCRDGKARRVESGTFPLAHGVPGRVGLLRGYGNAIVPALAAEFIKAYLEATVRKS